MARFPVALTILALALPRLAAAEEGKPPAGGDPMAGWRPPKITNEARSRKEIEATLKKFDAAGRAGEIDAAVALLDFPVLMVTDDAKGQGMGETWTKEQWTERMRPFYAHPMKDARITHKYAITVVSDSLAQAHDDWTMTRGGKKVGARGAMILVRRDGSWRMKSMMEGGWGDLPSMTGHEQHGQAAPPAPSGEATAK